MKETKKIIKINVECTELDIAIKKANQLRSLLQEVKQIIDSLVNGQDVS